MHSCIHYYFQQLVAGSLENLNQYGFKLMLADPSILEYFPGLANVGWPMSHEMMLPSADPSTMGFMAEHYVSEPSHSYSLLKVLYLKRLTTHHQKLPKSSLDLVLRT
jgi:hypothetical protein